MLPAAPQEVPENFRRAIVAAFPDLAQSTFAVAGRGWHSLAVEVDGRLIMKFPEGAEAEHALIREARLLGAVRPFVRMPVPDMSIESGPPLFSVHAKLAGAMLEPADYLRLSEIARAHLAEEVADFLTALHAIDAERMQAAGAEPIGLWDARDSTLAPVWPLLPDDVRHAARAAIAAYRDLGPDPLGEVYGFFDAHGWNMAFDHAAERLNGIFDFADSGFGPVHREFVQVSLISPDLAARTMRAYTVRTGKALDPRRVFLLAAAMRLSELAGAVETGAHVDAMLDDVLGWFRQQSVR
jgi:aminoglycoside phosphotransferase (APT) family kinase protein